LNELPKNIDFEWWILSKAILENIKNSPELRKQILSIPKEELSEKLSYNFLNSNLGFNKTVEKLKERYNDSLIKVLALDEIPKEQINVDISSTRIIYPAEEGIKRIIENDYFPFLQEKKEIYQTSKEEKIYTKVNNWSFKDWITKEEKELLIKRYIYTRENNILLLATSLLETKKDLKQEKITLENWVKIKNNLDFESELDNIFNINNWWSRKKIKDRIFEIDISWKTYILKERKTKFHTDTITSWHIDWLTSFEEFEVAKKLNKEWTNNDWIISIEFEKPITSVLFPNWYQFTIFERNDIFNNLDNGINIESNIYQNPEQFKEEYEDVLKNYSKYCENSDVIKYSKYFPNSFLSKINIFKKKKPHLTYKDYSKLKSKFISEDIYIKYRDKFEKLWYKDEDGNIDYEIITKSNKNWFKVYIFWYDFEYVREVENNISKKELKFWDEGDNIILGKLSNLWYNKFEVDTNVIDYASAFLYLDEFKNKLKKWKKNY
jgi:hypothetical protein